MSNAWETYKKYFKVIGKYPLHLCAAFIAAILCDLLFALQPLFLKTFINQAAKGVDKNHLLIITLFMLFGLLMAFIFEYIGLRIRYTLEEKIDYSYRMIYHQGCVHQQTTQVNAAARMGLKSLAAFSLNMTYDVILILTNMLLILGFLASEQLIVGGTVFSVLILSLLFTFKLTNKIGKITKTRERFQTKIIKLFNKKNADDKDRIALDYLKYYPIQFRISTILAFNSFFLFKVLPLIILVLYAFKRDISLGSIASVFIYLGMLAIPYQRLTELLRISSINFSKASLFREDFEMALDAYEQQSLFSKGFLLTLQKKRAGAPLSSSHLTGIQQTLFYDDMDSSEQLSDEKVEEKKKHLEQLLHLGHNRPVLLYSDDPLSLGYAHLILSDSGVRTTLGDAKQLSPRVTELLKQGQVNQETA